jgi:hypothetical protein
MNIRYATLAIFVGALVALSVFATVGGSIVLADSHEGQGDDRGNLGSLFNDHFQFGQVNMEDNAFSFVSTSQTTSKDLTSRVLFAFYARTEDAPTFAVALLNYTSSSNDMGRNASVTWAVGAIKVLGVFEYNDTANTGVYNKTIDGRPLSSINFEDMDWTLYAKQITGSNGAQGYQVNITGSKGSFVFTMSAEVFNTGVSIAGTKLAPTEAKIDFNITNYPFVSKNSRLGLLISYGGQEHYGNITSIVSTVTSGSGEDEVQTINRQTTAVISKGAFSYFTWSPTASVDGQTVTVKSEQLNNGTFARIILNYPQGSSIIHDPILGVGSGSASQIPAYSSAVSAISGTSLDIFLVAGSAVVIVLVSALALAARRRAIEPRLMV